LDSSAENVDKNSIKDKLSKLEDWNSVLDESRSAEHPTYLGPLTLDHFRTAFKEVPPSLTDEMQTLIELRKWDKLYGETSDGRKSGSNANSWGF
jgi:SpoVK/Ycf46/Vps4 family AAA+-type ATPase